MIIPYQDALTKVEMLFEQCDSEKLRTLIISRLKKYCSISTGIKISF